MIDGERFFDTVRGDAAGGHHDAGVVEQDVEPAVARAKFGGDAPDFGLRS